MKEFKHVLHLAIFKRTVHEMKRIENGSHREEHYNKCHVENIMDRITWTAQLKNLEGPERDEIKFILDSLWMMITTARCKEKCSGIRVN